MYGYNRYPYHLTNNNKLYDSRNNIIMTKHNFKSPGENK